MAADRSITLARSYLSELSELAIRVQLHLEIIKEQFFSGEGFSLGERPDKLDLLKNYRDYVATVIAACIELDAALEAETISVSDAIASIAQGFDCIKELHQDGLAHLP